MKEITFSVPDDMVQLLVEWTKHIPEIEIVQQKEATEYSLDGTDRRMALAMQTLKNNGAIRYNYDYTWIMAALGDGVLKDFKGFRSPQKFIDYLRNIGVEQIPCRSTISDYNNKVFGTFPDWEFTDTSDPSEVLRRKNIVRQFLSAYNKV